LIAQNEPRASGIARALRQVDELHAQHRLIQVPRCAARHDGAEIAR
jgi:hypothetical protein